MATRMHSTEDYLEALYFLAFPIGEYGPIASRGPAPAARVAEMLGVSAATASEMLKRLETDGLVSRRTGRPVLTNTGRAQAERIVRNHRIIERFLTDFMGYTPAESHEHADAMGDAFDDEMVGRLSERLGHPERCPHGWPIDTAVEQAENHDLRPLDAIEAPAYATIVRLAEHNGDLLRWFYDQGLIPGTTLELTAIQPAAGQRTIRVAGTPREISDTAAAGLFVRVDAP
jgi:DtxR family transcriptional regulator, Mn-dependent transcriptional regulator